MFYSQKCLRSPASNGIGPIFLPKPLATNVGTAQRAIAGDGRGQNQNDSEKGDCGGEEEERLCAQTDQAGQILYAEGVGRSGEEIRTGRAGRRRRGKGRENERKWQDVQTTLQN